MAQYAYPTSDITTAGWDSTATLGHTVYGGVVGDYMRAQDRNALDITKTLEIIVATAVEVPSSGSRSWISKTNLSNQWAYWFGLLSTDKIRVSWSPNGTVGSQINVDSSATLGSVGINSGDPAWVRVRLTTNNGSNRVAEFHYSTDSLDTNVDSVSWTQLGSTQTSTTSSIAATTSHLTIGAFGTTGTPHIGNIYGVWVRNGLSGEPVGHLSLDGTGDYANTTADYSLGTNVVEMIGLVALDDWTPVANQGITANSDNVDARGCIFYIDSSPVGRLAYDWYDGTVRQNVNSSVSPTVSDGEHLWCRVVHDLDVGGTDSTVIFYTSSDPIDTDLADVTWTQLGTTYNHGSTTSITAAVDPLGVGRASGGSNYLAGKFYAGWFYDDSALVASCDWRVGDLTTDLIGNTWSKSGDAVWNGQVVDLDFRTFGSLGGVHVEDSSDFIYASYHASFDFSDDCEFIFYASLFRDGTNYAPIISQGDPFSASGGFVLVANPVGDLRWQSRNSGDTAPNTQSESTACVLDHQPRWYRVRVDVGNTVSFWYSDDPASTSPTSVSWTTAGTDAAGASASTGSTADLRIGTNLSGDAAIDQIIYVLYAYSDLGTTLVASPDYRTSDMTTDGQGRTWTKVGDSFYTNWIDSQTNAFKVNGNVYWANDLYPEIDEPSTPSDTDYMWAIA